MKFFDTRSQETKKRTINQKLNKRDITSWKDENWKVTTQYIPLHLILIPIGCVLKNICVMFIEKKNMC